MYIPMERPMRPTFIGAVDMTGDFEALWWKIFLGCD
jgi:hypothetical protein